MENKYDVSVVISTYNRCELLPSALESLIAQETGGVQYEIVVVDNNSSDRTREVIEAFIARGAGNMRYIFEGKQGLSHGWNTGIGESSAPVIAFTDDDISVAPDWIASIKRVFDEHEQIDFTGGKVLPRWSNEPPAWLTRDHWSPLALQDYGDAPFYTNREKPVCLLGKSFRRTVFERVGLFTPEMGRIKDGIGSAEDHDLISRLYLIGAQGMYAPNVIMYAEVQPERTTKAYHRKWHAGHGKFGAMMRLAETTTREGHLTEESIINARLFGVPGFVYRQTAGEAVKWLKESIRRRESKAIYHENQVRYHANYIRKTYQLNATNIVHSPLKEISIFAKALLSK